MIELTWDDVAQHICDSARAPRDQLVFGVPRGGTHIAQLLSQWRGCTLVGDPTDAEVIVDDIYDSGRTHERWTSMRELSDKGWWNAYERRDFGGWVQFPWERHEQETAAVDAAARLLQALGVEGDGDDPDIADTPERMVKALREMTAGYVQDPAEILSRRFVADEYDEMVVVRDIPFESLCEHHLLPFSGVATVGYVADGTVVGLSKIPRLVHCFAKRLQLQERMTAQITNALWNELAPIGVGTVIRASHTCMSHRGIRSAGEMVTSALQGVMRTDPTVRMEFMGLAGVG